MPLLSCISELTHKLNGDEDKYNLATEYWKSYDKMTKALQNGLIISDMGTRRRFFYQHHDNVIRSFVEASEKSMEELSVSDTVVKITNKIYTQLLNKLSIGKSFISKERNVIIKKGIFDYQTAGKLKNTSFIKVKYVVYYFNNEQEHQAYMKYGYFRMNSSADYENKTINLYLSMINNQPDTDFKSDIQHEVNHIFQYDNGQQKDEDFYKRIIELNKSGNKLDKIIARALYYTFPTEQDSFVSQYYAYLKRNNIPIQQAINYRDDKNCPYYDFDTLFDYIDNISDELTDDYTQNKLGMSSRKMFMILNNADDRFRNKLGKVIMRYVQEKELSEEFKYSEIHLKIDPRLSFILECYKKGINEEESEYFE